MKKILLLLFLLPFLGFGQNIDLVQWNGSTDLVPTIFNEDVAVSNVTGAGITGPTPSYDGIVGTGWTTGNTLDTGKYFQITLNPLLDVSVTLNELRFNYKGNLSSYQIRYSKAADFSNPITIANVTNANPYNTSVSGDLTGLNIVVNAGERIYIRFYAYNGGGQWKLMNGGSLKLRGTATSPSKLSGSYIIGSAAGANFPTITTAVKALIRVGVSGPVRFLIDEDQIVTSPIIINQFTGSSATNTLTIKPNLGKNITIKAVNVNDYTTAPSVFKFDGAKNIIIDGSNTNGGITRNLTLLNDDNINYTAKAVVWIASKGTTGSSNITVKNSILKFSYRNNGGLLSTGVYSGNNGLGDNNRINVQEADANNSNITVKNNQTVNVKDAVYINGNSNAAISPTGWKIEGNTIGGDAVDSQKPFRGMYISNALSYEVFGNTISGIKNTVNEGNDCAGVALYGSSSGKVYGNYISNIVNEIPNNSFLTGGVLFKGTGANNVYNNFISKVYVNRYDNVLSDNSNFHTRGHGIFINSGSVTNVYFNTVVMSGALSTTAATACLYIQGGSGINIKNNIFVNNDVAAQSFAVFRYNSGTISSISNNDYYVANAAGKFLNRIGGTTYTATAGATSAPAAWNTATGDSNSIIFLPNFVSLTDLHLQNGENASLKAAIQITGITTDIDGDIRATIPYIGADEIKCTYLTTWNGGGWSPRAPDFDTKVIFTNSYNKDQVNEAKDIKACSCEVRAGAEVLFKTGNTLDVINEVQVNDNAKLTFENNASLVQHDDIANNSGIIYYHRYTAAVKRYDYTYWSSPVKGQTMHDLSPKTFYDKYYSYDNGWKVNKDGTLPMEKGEGYIIRAPQDHEINVAKVDETPVFKGIPNNGKVEKDIEKDKTYLLGNPYPSAINADEFLRVNEKVLEGTLYFWTHNSPPSAAILGDKKYNYTTADYATYNRTGGVGTAPATFTTGGAVSKSGAHVTGKIAAGQGFFAPASKDGGNLVFNNAMRYTVGAANYDNSQFFKLSTSSKTTTTVTTTEKSRIWLNLSNNEGAFKQTLIGYIAGATNEYDSGFDGMTFNGNQYVDFYSVNNELNLAIQGRALPFAKKDSVALGYKSTIKGEFQISIDQADGVLTDQNVFLEDKVLKVQHDLKKEAYTFSTEKGTFNNRFVLRYVDKNAPDEIIVPEIPADSNIAVLVSVQNGEIKVNSPVELIDKVIVYDVVGRIRYQNMKVADKGLIVRNIYSSHQVLVVKTTLENGKTVTSKIVY